MLSFSVLPLMQRLFRRPFGIHSPFLYDLAENCLQADERLDVFDELESLRRSLCKDQRRLQVMDHGSGGRFGAVRAKAGINKSAKPNKRSTTLGSQAGKALMPPKYSRLLFRLSKHFAPKRIIELGTSFGISAAYLSLGQPQASLDTVEGCPETADVAREVLNKAAAGHVQVHTGTFRQVLPGLVATGDPVDLVFLDGDHSYDGVMNNMEVLLPSLHNDSVVILDDIRWTRQMWRAWQSVSALPSTTLKVDLGRMGLVFFRRQLSVQNLQIWI